MVAATPTGASAPGGTLVEALRRKGSAFLWLARYWLLFGLAERGFDRKLPVTTAEVLYEPGSVASPNLPHGQLYEATPVALARAVLKDIPERLDGFTFIDFGSGRGRMLLLAAERPFKRVLGVEYSRELHEAAAANIERCGLSGRVASVHCDATEVAIPPGPCVLYFYNPFDDAVFERVLGNIEASYLLEPRPIYVIYYNAVHADLLDSSPLLRRVRLGWLARLRQRMLVLTSIRLYRTP